MNSSAPHATGARQFDSQCASRERVSSRTSPRVRQHRCSDAAKVSCPSPASIRVAAVRAAAVLSSGAYKLLSRLPHPPISSHRLPRMRRHARAYCSAARPDRRGYTSECPLRVASARRAGRCDRELSTSPAAPKLSLASADNTCRLRDHRAGHRLHHSPKPATVSRGVFTLPAALQVPGCAIYRPAQGSN